MLDYVMSNLMNIGALILLAVFLFYYLPKGIRWWFTTKDSDIKDDPNEKYNARKPQDYL